MKRIILILGILVLVGCTNAEEATRVLKLDGVADIKITGYAWFSCGDHDFYHTGFSGTRNGQPITGVVCSGLIFKASTIRY